MRKKYQYGFSFFDTLEEAENFIKNYMESLKKDNKYLYNKNKYIHVGNWSNDTETKKIVWYY